MKTIETFESIKKVFETSGSTPVLVTGTDLEDYVCKYPRGIPTHHLLAEYLGYRFAEIWNLNIPEAVFINVLPEHYVQKSRLQPRYFHNTCFGSYYLKDAMLLEDSLQFLVNNDYSKKKIQQSDSLLYIALFDIWIANEDRNHNNYNLLLNPTTSKQFDIVAIDHDACFQSRTFEIDFWSKYPLTENESIISSNIFKKYTNKNITSKEKVDEVIENFYLYASISQSKIKEILEDIPSDWGIELTKIKHFLTSTIFTKEWLSQSEQNFKEYLQSNIINSIQ